MEAGKAAQGAMRITFAFPMQDSACGTWEYFASVKDRPQPVDISGYERIVFMARSGDGSAHKVRIEVVEFDPHAAYDQGIVADSEPFTIGPDWQRHEVALDKLLPEMFDRRKGRQVGLRIDRRDQAEAKGVVLVDNLTLAGKR
jgi:hypothetical protein